MNRRRGHTYRIYDGARYTVAIGGDYIADGSHRRPRINIFDREHPGSKFSIPLPLVRFRRCYRFRYIGGLHVYRLYSRSMRWICAGGRV